VRKLLEIALGILTAIGGFVDIGDLVASTETGARFGLGLVWVLVVGVVGIIIYAEMAGRVASMSGRAVFDLVRERLGAGVGLLNLAASFFITLLTLAAEIGGPRPRVQGAGGRRGRVPDAPPAIARVGGIRLASVFISRWTEEDASLAQPGR
jgi:hypothetical protein